MRNIKEFIKRYLIFSKRLLMKKSFLAILLLIPLVVGAVEIAVDKGESGVVVVALAMEDGNDLIAQEIVDDLTLDEGLVRFELCETPSEAITCVETGKSDAAWILQDNLGERIKKFINHTHANNAFVTVIQRENSTFLSVALEKLSSSLYSSISKILFLEEGKELFPEMSYEDFEEFYSSVNAGGEDLFEFIYAKENSADIVREKGANSFLVSPLRGFLAIMVVLGGVAVAMYYINDEEHGVFIRLPRGEGFAFSIAYHAAAIIMVATVMLAAIFAMKISRGLGYELLAISIYSVAVIGFCMCARLIVGNIRAFGAIAPILILIMVVVCPILYPAPNLAAIQYLIPPYYYLRSMSNVLFLWYMAAYSVVILILAFLLHRLRFKQREG